MFDIKTFNSLREYINSEYYQKYPFHYITSESTDTDVQDSLADSCHGDCDNARVQGDYDPYFEYSEQPHSFGNYSLADAIFDNTYKNSYILNIIWRVSDKKLISMDNGRVILILKT